MSEQVKFRNIGKSMKGRIALTLLFGLLLFVLLLVALLKLQLIDYDTYKAKAEGQQLRSSIITANRGTIYDTNMNVLAQSATAWTVTLSPNEIKESTRELIANAMVEFLGADYDTVMTKMGQNSYYSIVKRKVEQDVVNQIRAWIRENGIRGINFTEDSKRYYPNGNFLATVMGFVGTDNYGLGGLESYYNSYLEGTSGRILTARNSRGGAIFYEYETYYEANQGNSLVLTVDEVVQFYLEKYIEETMIQRNVKYYGAGIVMNVNTGEILGMTNKPDFDPNTPLAVFNESVRAELAELSGTDGYSAAYLKAQQEQWANKAIQYIYEPGSVYKVITASAALESGTSTLNSTFHCSGRTTVAGITMQCHKRTGHGAEDFTKAVVNSCNVAFIKIGQDLGADNFYHYFKAFGLTGRTGIDLPGEGNSLYYTADQMGIVELSSCSFGQSNAVTPIQLITAVAAAVNGGYLVQPHMVSKVVDENGVVIKSFDPLVKRQVISAETSKIISLIMEQVVNNTTSVNAYVKGYRIGGKTGTSQKLSGSADEYVASFCGIVPANNPEIAVLLLFDTPQKGSHYGSAVAAPVACKLLRTVLPHLGINPSYTAEELLTADKAVPTVVGETSAAASTKIKSAGFSYKVIGDGEQVVTQYPAANSSVPAGSIIYLYTDETEPETVNVPNLSGKTINAATALLKELGLNVRINGAVTSEAVVYDQSALNILLPLGSVVDLDFIDYNVAD